MFRYFPSSGSGSQNHTCVELGTKILRSGLCGPSGKVISSSEQRIDPKAFFLRSPSWNLGGFYSIQLALRHAVGSLILKHEAQVKTTILSIIPMEPLLQTVSSKLAGAASTMSHSQTRPWPALLPFWGTAGK